ncbi:MAG: ADP-ribosylglycohydrolase family protein [Dehalococcoidales bacterium]|nr:ADP-ribosylglycohydrolase family protein [Dehalococcoidales bacterium]
MLGAIAGDIIGSSREFKPVKTTEFPLFTDDSTFTDDSVLTIAIADCILNNGQYECYLKEYGRKFPGAGYGERFSKWLVSNSYQPYNSFGNGSAMRVSPAGFALDTIEEVLTHAKASAIVTHNHPEGIKGAQAVAAAVFMAKGGCSKDDIRQFIQSKFSYNLSQKLDDIRPNYSFDVTCQGSVPQSIIAFLESENYEDAVRKAISLGGDADTMACITGGIAEAYYGEVPKSIAVEVRRLLDIRLMDVVDEFYESFAFSD